MRDKDRERERQTDRQTDRYNHNAHDSLRAAAALKSRQFSLFLAIFRLQLSEAHAHVEFHSVHVLWTCDTQLSRDNDQHQALYTATIALILLPLNRNTSINDRNVSLAFQR